MYSLKSCRLAGPQQFDDGGQFGPVGSISTGRVPLRRRRQAALAPLGQRRGDRPDRQHAIGPARGDGALRHPAIGRLGGILHDHQSAGVLDGHQSGAAVRTRARQDDARGARAIGRRQGLQQEVERQPGARPGPPRRQMQGVADHRQVGARRNDVDVVRSQRQAVLRLAHGQLGAPGQQLRHQTDMRGIEVLHQHERHPAAGLDGRQQLGAGIETACRGADADDGSRGLQICREGRFPPCLGRGRRRR